MNNDFAQTILELNEAINSKAKLLQVKAGLNSPTQGEFNNVATRIRDLESSAKDIDQNYPGNQNMLINFKKRAIEIRTEIEGLK